MKMINKCILLTALGISCVSHAQTSRMDLSCTERVASPGTNTSFTLRSMISVTPYVLTKQVIQAGTPSGAPLVMKFDSEGPNGGMLFVSDYENGVAIGVHKSNLMNATVAQQMNLYQMRVIQKQLDPKPSRLDCRVTSIR